MAPSLESTFLAGPNFESKPEARGRLTPSEAAFPPSAGSLFSLSISAVLALIHAWQTLLKAVGASEKRDCARMTQRLVQIFKLELFNFLRVNLRFCNTVSMYNLYMLENVKILAWLPKVKLKSQHIIVYPLFFLLFWE